MPGKPPSVIKFLKEQEIKQEQLRQQLANQEARRGQEEIEKREAKEIADYLFSEYDEALARSHPPPPAPIMPTEAQLAYINLVRAHDEALSRAACAAQAAPIGSAEAARALAAYEAALAEYGSLEDSRRAAKEYAAAVAPYEVAKEDKNEQEIRDKAKEISDRLFKQYQINLRSKGSGGILFKNRVVDRPYLQNAIKEGFRERLLERRKAHQQSQSNSKKAAEVVAAAADEALKEAERQRIRERNEQQIRDKEEELARLRVSLRPRVEEDVAKKGWTFFAQLGQSTHHSPLTGNKVYDEIFAELIQPRVEQFQKEKSRKGVQEAYEYISRRQKDGIKHLGQWIGSELTPTEEEILERLKIAINGGSGFESDISKKIFNEYLKASNHSGGRRKTRRGRKHRRRSTHRKN
jgi:hypothetical protein